MKLGGTMIKRGLEKTGLYWIEEEAMKIAKDDVEVRI